MENPHPTQTTSSPTSHKRPLDEDATVATVSTPTKANAGAQSGPSTPLSVHSTVRTPSPLKNPTGLSSEPSDANNPTSSSTPAALTTQMAASKAQQPPTKRRKLTDQEKEGKRLEEEAKKKAKAELKAQKEEEKRVKDEEKRKKAEEREEKKRIRDLELQQREEEKRKKDKAQLRLNSFFVKPKPSAASEKTSTDPKDAPTTATIPLQSSTSLPTCTAASAPPQKVADKKALTDYERVFLPFQLPSRSVLAPYNHFLQDPEALEAARTRLDKLPEERKKYKDLKYPEALRTMLTHRGPRGADYPSVVEIVERLNGTPGHPIDLTANGKAIHDPLELLKEIPMKYLLFPEDVRPPYYGTYTKPHTPREASRLARNPFARRLRDTDYDYDSEAEWEEPEEGEDLDSDGEEDAEEEGDDDMEGFLDDEEDLQLKRRLISADLEPVQTGLCWEDCQGASRLNDGSGAISTEFEEFRMGYLLEPQPRSIDPFSTAYWAPDPVAALSSTLTVPGKEATANGLMNPPRAPLTQRPVNGMLNTHVPGTEKNPNILQPKASKAQKRMIPADQLPQFKAAIEGSDLTKIALVEHLKKLFPKFPKDAITNTVSAVAARVGTREADKRWVLFP